jgi:homogentisate 1,2-dioxygenase
MIERIVAGSVPRKHHLQHRDPSGKLLHEECLTQDGFEGPYTIAYHLNAPHTQVQSSPVGGWRAPEAAPSRPLAKRHYQSQKLEPGNASALTGRVPLLFNRDLTLGVVKPTQPDAAYFNNGDGDDLFYIHQGGGILRSAFGDLSFGAEEYVYVPRGTVHRFLPAPGIPQHWLWMELKGGLHVPRQWRNPVGQLRMDAPYCHRDFRKVTFTGPQDEGLRALVVKRGEAFHGFNYLHSPLDVVGYDGTVYPWAFPILNFQPRAGLVHLPPTWHGTFASRGSLICSFVPRKVDWHPEAIPCPYPHSSVDVDEFLFYCRGNFTSRRGVGSGSISHHPAGVAHGPHPGAYEASIGHQETNELAVMLDCALPLEPTAQALEIEDPGYHGSFIP